MTVTWTDPRAAQPPPDPAQPPRPHRKRNLRVRWAAGALGAGLAVAAVVVLYPGAGHPAASGRPSTPAAPPAPAGTTLHVEGGVVVGFPRTEAGARAAAANIDAVLGSELMYGPGRSVVLDAVADPTARPALQQQADAAYEAGRKAFGLDAAGLSTQDGLTFVARRLPAGAHVVGWTPDSAVVQLWDDELIGTAGAGSTLPVRQGWATDTVTLRWTDGRWRYVSEAGVAGPVPVATQSPSDSVGLAAAAGTFGALTYG